MDFLQNLNLRRLFGGNDQQPSTGFPINTTGLFDDLVYRPKPGEKPEDNMRTLPWDGRPSQVQPLNAPDSNLAALRGRARPYMDQYAELLKGQPNRQDYQLSKVGKALAAASGMLTGSMQGAERGINVFKNLAEEPYRRATEDYSTKGGRLKELAGVEAAQIAEQDKLEAAIAADEAKRRDDLRQMIKTQSDIDLSDARIKDMEERRKVLGLSWGTNAVTGMLELRDLKTNQIVPIHKIAETPKETDTREFEQFKKKFDVDLAGEERMEGIRQGNRIKIKGMDQVHDKEMLGLRQRADLYMQNSRHADAEELIKLRSNLERLSPTQRNAAFEGAYKRVILQNPELRDRLFDIDPSSGAATLKKDYEPAVFDLFNRAVETTMRENMGESSTGFSGVPNAAPAMGVNPNNTTSGPGNNTGIDPARQAQAVTWLTQNGFESDPASVAEWIRQDDAEKLSAVNPQPQVALPPQAPPQIALPQVVPQGIVNPQGMFRNFGNTTPLQPQDVINLRERAGMIGDYLGRRVDDVRAIPGNIYGPQTRRIPGR